MNKIVAIWWRTPGRATRHEVVNIVSDDDIKTQFSELMFYRGANNLLVKYADKMYVVEPVDCEAYTYKRRTVEYHPLAHL